MEFLSPPSLLVHLAWLPLVLVLFLKVYKGPYPLLAALLAHFIGGIMVLPALAMQLLWNQLVPEDQLSSVLEMPLWFVPVEEWAKLVAALLAARVLGYEPPRRCFLPLSIAAALGFAATESALAVSTMGVDVLPVRVMVAIPGHIIFTMVAAAGLIAREGTRLSRWGFAMWWGLAAAAHVAYNTMILHQPDASLLEVFQWLLALGGLAGILAFFKLWQARRTPGS